MNWDRDSRLTPLPENPRDRALWLQRAAGFELMRNVRQIARDRAARQLDSDAATVAGDLVDSALYSLMMLVEGALPTLHDDDHYISVDLVARVHRLDDGAVVSSRSLHDGDGPCMAFHQWIGGDFGAGDSCPVAPLPID